MNNKFAINIRKLRKEKKLSRQQMAEFLKISKPGYVGYEQGRREPSYDTLIKLANFFDVTTDYLLGLENDED